MRGRRAQGLYCGAVGAQRGGCVPCSDQVEIEASGQPSVVFRCTSRSSVKPGCTVNKRHSFHSRIRMIDISRGALASWFLSFYSSGSETAADGAAQSQI